MSSNLETLKALMPWDIDNVFSEAPKFSTGRLVKEIRRSLQQNNQPATKEQAINPTVAALLKQLAEEQDQADQFTQTSINRRASGQPPLDAKTVITPFTETDQTETDRAAFKTSTSFGRTFNGESLKWSQPNGKGSNVDITYSFANNLNIPGLNTTQVKSLFTEALSVWADYAPLIFKEVKDPGNGREVDIRVNNEFIDGRSNTLAYAYFPGGGDITFDSGDNWNRALFLETAVHEIGHSLGLAHEEDTGAIMNPVIANRYAGNATAFLLQDDINGIVSLYGRGQGAVQPLGQPTPTPLTPAPPTPTPPSKPTPSPTPRTRNIVRNGSFENSSVQRNEFGVFSQVKGWSTLSGSGIQIDKRHKIFGRAAKGGAWAELDSNSNSAIGQQLRTKDGQSYRLSFQYSPHQGLSATTNGIEVYWDNQLLDTVTQGGGRQNQWQEFSYDVVGQARSRLSFKAVGTSDGVGGFIDSVAVRAVNNVTQLGSAEVKEEPFLATNKADMTMAASSIFSGDIATTEQFI